MSLRDLVVLALLPAVTACAARAPLPDAPGAWRDSLKARPLALATATFAEVDAATPSEPGRLFEASARDRRDEGVVAGLLACRLTIGGDLRGVDAYPDRIVEVAIDDRVSRFARPKQREWDFSLGLVDLAPGDAISLRVVEDRLVGGRVVLQGTRRFDGGTLGWTHREFGVRTSVRCRVPSEKRLARELAQRLRRLETQEQDALRRVAAIVGWSDPRVRDQLDAPR